MSVKLEQLKPATRALVLATMRAEDAERALAKSKTPWATAAKIALEKESMKEFAKNFTLRQERKPLLNKLEKQVLLRVQHEHPGENIHAQSIRFRLANGAWYKPDLWAMTTAASGARTLQCWEAKCLNGKGAAKGVLAVKVAATQYPEIDFWLVTKSSSGLRFERVLP